MARLPGNVLIIRISARISILIVTITITTFDNGAHLERAWGSHIREHFATGGVDLGNLANWMLTTLGVSVPSRVCQIWLILETASCGRLLVCQDVEKQLGDCLRLGEYKDRFSDDVVAQLLSEALLVRPRLVRSWL